MRLRNLRPDEVTFILDVTNDVETRVKNTVHANGVYLSVDDILDRVRSGDRYAWFAARVRVSWNAIFEGSDWTWSLSFESKEAFESSKQYEGMKTAALKRLQEVLNDRFKSISSLIEVDAP